MAFATDFRIGPALSEPLLNFFFRGVTPTRPTAIYFSLGTGADIDSVTEIAGITRTAMQCSRGALSGHDAAALNYPYQSTGYGGPWLLRTPVNIHVPSGFSGTIGSGLNGYVMAFDAASGGNVFFITPFTSTRVIGGNIVALHIDGSARTSNRRLTWYNGDTSYDYVSDMAMDWLFRGYESLTQLFPVATYPNMQVEFFYKTNLCGVGVYTAVPRNTASWTAPAIGPLPLSRKIVNSNAILSPVITTNQGQNTAIITIRTRLGAAVNGYETIFSQHVNGGAGTTIAIGDFVNLPAGTFEVCKG